MIAELASEFGIPPEVMDFVDSGFLEIVSNDINTKTVEFHIPSLRFVDPDDHITTYSVTWIHPLFNEKFCHYYDSRPGDLPNFWVTKDTTDVGDEQIDALEIVDDLVAWLSQIQESTRV